jgi:predicted RNA methylase
MVAKSVDADVLQILRSMECNGNIARLKSGQLDRLTYQRVDKVLKAAGGKWNRDKGGHVFDGPAADALASILTDGEYRNQKQEDGFFETPEELADHVADLAEIARGLSVLEPSAGKGRLVAAAARRGARPVVAVEINPQYIRALIEFGATAVLNKDFLAIIPQDFSPAAYFDRILMNPPFGQRGSQEDIAHVLHAWNFLRDGCRLVAIMSAGWTFRENKRSREFRAFVKTHGWWEKLPEGAFKESGTMVNAVVAVLDK